MPTYVATTKSKARLIVSFGIDFSQMTDLHYVIYFLLRIFSESIFIAFNLAPEDNGVKFHECKCKLFSVKPFFDYIDHKNSAKHSDFEEKFVKSQIATNPTRI